MKKYLSALLSFSRKERNGVLVLFFLLLLLLGARLLTGLFLPRPHVDFSAFERHVAMIAAAGSFKRDSPPSGEESGFAAPVRRSEHGAGTPSSPAPSLRGTTTHRADSSVSIHQGAASRSTALFPFDPNTVTKSGLLELGIRPKVADILLNYRAAGGRFRKSEDLAKVYGLREAVYRKLLPFVRIREAAPAGKDEGIGKDEQIGKNRRTGERKPPDEPNSPDEPKPSGERKPPGSPCTVVEINSADSAALLPLRGIGPVLSSRVVRYRQRLGGFHSVDQLLEVYGMDTASFYGFRDCLRLDSSRIEKINLNEAGYHELRRLPYWSPAQIRVILNYREQHGRFPETKTLFNIRALDAQTIQKVMPYLSTE